MIADSQLLGFALIVLVAAPYCLAGVTDEQMMQSGRMVREVCQPKFKLTDDVANGIRDGKIPDDQSVRCYINCIMEMMNIMKKGKLNYDSAMKQVDLLLPDRLKDSYKNGLTTCRHSIDGMKNVNCQPAQKLLLCIRDNIPEFLFP